MNSKPNILFILIDDMGWRDLTCYGSSFYETPNIDKLAIDGMKFTDAYASCPVCSPTRASIMTGKYPATLGLTDYIGAFAKGKLLAAPFIDHLPLEEKSLATALKEGGYRTFCVGKWHLGSEKYWPEHHGFDVNVAGCDWGHPKFGFFSPYGNPRLKNGPWGEYLTDRLTDEAIKLITSENDTPFFLYMSHYAVHMPLDCPKSLIEKYKKKASTLGLDRKEIFKKGEYFPIEKRKNQRIKRRVVQSDPNYAGMIENLDWNTGRLMDALEKCGKMDNTIIIFTSDNGGVSTCDKPPTTNAPLCEGKGWMFEGGTRVPLIMKWPHHIKPGSECDFPITSTDFYPTLLNMVGLPLIPTQHCDGVSFLPLLKGENEINRKDLFWHYPHYSNLGNTPGSSIRSENWKLIQFFEDNHYELYNLKDDISENNDLASINTEKVQTLKIKLENWQKSVEAKYPLPNVKWKVDQKKMNAFKRQHVKDLFDLKP